MSSRRRSNDDTSRAGRIIGWAFVLSVTFSAGLLVGLQLDGDPRAWLVSTNSSDADATTESERADKQDQNTIFSFYEKLSGGEPPEASTTAQAEGRKTSEERANTDESGEDEPPTALYTVQISAFPDLSKAESKLEDLIARGMNPHVVAAPTDDGTFYRLRIGRYHSIEAAEAARKRFSERLDSRPVVTDF